MKWHWLDVPDARPLNSAAFFICELNTLLAGLAKHRRKNLGIKIALIKSDLAAANHSSHDAGKSFDTTHGAYRVSVPLGDGADFESQLGRRSQCIVARTHGRGT